MVTRAATVSYATAGFGNTLTHDLARGVPSAQAFFPSVHWESVVREIDAHTYPREQLVQILKQAAAKTNAPAPVLGNIERLRQTGTYVVATGQQAGLFGGPLYSLYKALSALKLARTLETRAGGSARFVPVFWVAGDDHDLAEIDHADFYQHDGTVRRIRAKFNAESAGRSSCDVTLDAGALEELRAELIDAFKLSSPPTAPADPEELARRADALVAAYRGQTLSEAFGVLLQEWLGPLGLVIVQSCDVRPLGAELYRRELADFDVTGRLIHEAAVSLERYGYKPGFSGKLRRGPHFFVVTEKGHIRARLEPLDKGARFQESSPAFESRGIAPRTYSRTELEALIAREPGRFSSSAGLRPVLQQTIFPVAVAVLGPGEIDYWAQLKKVHDQFGVVFPVVVPRATLTLLDERAAQNLRRMGMEPGAPDLFLDADALRKKLAHSGALSESITAHTAAILAEFDKMAGDVHAVDRGLKPLFDKTRERFTHELQRIAEKTAASLNQHEGAGQARAQQLSAFVRPKNTPQERVLVIAQFIARYPNLPAELLEIIDPDLRDHLVVTLG
jgi:bacillithiol biosynthesis cysteine-adding enzyme BshC